MSPLNCRERVRLALQHREPDRVPYHFTFTVPARRKLEAFYSTAELEDLLGVHLAVYKARPLQPYPEERPGFWRDEFGVLWNRTVDRDIGVVEEYPLSGRSLVGYIFPDPHDPRRFERLPSFYATSRNRFRIASIGFSLFERAWSLRGIAELLVDMVEAPAWVDELLDAILAFQLEVIADAIRHDFDAVMFGDDWGQQRGLLMGPRLWRRFIKPRVAEMYGAVHRAGKAVFIHCCGKVQELFPELIGVGLDVFNPFQPEVMDLGEIKRQYGRDLSFYGGMSVQRVLPFGTPAKVRDEARRLMETVGRGGGYIIAPSHDMPGDIPVENMVAFIEAVRG